MDQRNIDIEIVVLRPNRNVLILKPSGIIVWKRVCVVLCSYVGGREIRCKTARGIN